MTPNKRRNKFWKWAKRKDVLVTLEYVLQRELLYSNSHWPCLSKKVPNSFKKLRNQSAWVRIDSAINTLWPARKK